MARPIISNQANPDAERMGKMGREADVERRAVLAAGVGLILGGPVAASGLTEIQKINPDEGVTAPEDLMKEHGVLNRCLLIYEEGIRRLQAKEEVRPEVFRHTAELIKKFVEEYHEKNEEKYIFPVFERKR